MSEHALTPWRRAGQMGYTTLITVARLHAISAEDDCTVAYVVKGDDARHIVHCVNTQDALVEVLEAYKQWEADVILNEDAWGLAGMAERPILTQALWDRLIEIQAMRNAALTAANATDDGGVK